MNREPIIFLVSSTVTLAEDSLEAALRWRYVEGYRIAVAASDSDPAAVLRQYRDNGEQVALYVVEPHSEAEAELANLIDSCREMYPDARRVVVSDHPAHAAVHDAADHVVLHSWFPPEKKLYPILDELLAEWRVSIDMPFTRVKGIMTVRAVRIRAGDSLHRAAEIIALSGISDLMVIDDNNNFVGVISVGDVLRAAMPDIDEVMQEGGTLEQAFRLFLRKGSELMYKPIEPLIIRNPLVVDPDDHVAKAAALMIEKNIHRLPVVKDGRLIGTVGRTDICQAVVGSL